MNDNIYEPKSPEEIEFENLLNTFKKTRCMKDYMPLIGSFRRLRSYELLNGLPSEGFYSRVGTDENTVFCFVGEKTNEE